MDDLQSWWEVPSIAHFCSLFRVAFNLLDFDIEELEEALLTDGVEINGSFLLQELIVRLLNGCFGNNGISVSNYQMYLRRLFRTRCREQGRKNPFNTDTDFQSLPLRTKVEILHALCDFRLDAEDVVDVLKNLDSDSLRVHPLGFDGVKSAYWYFYGTRLYREDYPKQKNKKSKDNDKHKSKKKQEEEESDDGTNTVGRWHVVCFTEEDWERVTESFSDSTNRDERALYSVLSEDFLPEIPRLFAEKERLHRKRLMEMAPRRTSSRIEKLKKQAEEDQTKHVEKEKEEFELQQVQKQKDQLRRAARAQRRSQSISEAESSDASSQPLTGRQTNNSLASATGQIYIKSSRQKVKTSHQFRSTREVLMTGLYKVLDKLKMHPDAWPFVDPVNEEYAPRYYSVIARPMDLQTMEDKLDNGEYGSLEQFKEDFQLIVDNCRQYNGSDNDYTRMVNRLHVSFMNLVDRHLEAEVSSQDEQMLLSMDDDDEDMDEMDENLPLRERSEEREKLTNKALIRNPSNSSISLSPVASIASDSDSSVTTLSSRSSKDMDWKKSRYGNYKKDKIKSKKFKNSVNRLRKRMKRKEEKEEPAPPPPPPSPPKLSSEDERVLLSDDFGSEDERLSILDNIETSGSEELLGTSDETDDDDDEDEDIFKNRKRKPIKKTSVVRNAAAMEELDEVTEQTLRDITKWLDDTPRYSDFSSNSNSPLHVPFTEDIACIDMDFRRRLHSEKHMRPRDRFSNELHRRKLLRDQMGLKRQRTIDRLQPGKSKGNLLSKENLQENVGSTDTTTCEKESNAPKLSLGKVLPTDILSFGIGESIKKEEEDESEEKPLTIEEEPAVDVKEEKPKEEEVEEPVAKVAKEPSPVEVEKKVEPEKIESKKEKPTPNLSAWFKAFGAPKSQAAVKKKPENEERLENVKSNKEEDSMEEDRDKRAIQSPTRRQRRTSTGSSVSERSSFSQDQFDGNSPRPSLDEPYLSPQPEVKSYHHSPVNGTIKVGFYQDTCFPRGTSEKSSSPREPNCSPRDIPSVSPRTPYCSPRNAHSMSPRDLSSSPREYRSNSPHDLRSPASEYSHYNSVPAFHAQNPLYTSVPPRYPPHIPYYDASKPLVEQYKNSEKTQLPVYPVKKRVYSEVENETPKSSTDTHPPSAFKGGSFAPTKEAVEHERTFTPTPGRMPTRITEPGILPSHLRLMEGYSEERHYLPSEPAAMYREQQNYNRVLSPYHMARPENHFPQEHNPNSSGPTSPLNFSNSTANKEEYSHNVPNQESPLNYGKELLSNKPPSSLAYPVNRLGEVMPSKVNNPYNRSIPELPQTLNYPPNPEMNKMSVPPLYKNQSDLIPGKINYNHPMADLMQGPARYNYQMSELMQGKTYNQAAVQLELMQGKGPPYLMQGNIYNRGEMGSSKIESKESEFANKPETKPAKKSRKKKNDTTAQAAFQQYAAPGDPKPAGSAFNFGPQLKDNYSTYLEGMRAAGPAYFPQPEGGATSKASGSYFLRPPAASYHPFMTPQYQQLLRHNEELLRPMMLHQGLLPPPAGYPPGYLGMHDTINRPSWL